MEGSAIRGDMLGGALPVEWLLEVQSDASEAAINDLVSLAEKTSPAQVYMTRRLQNTFALCANGSRLPVRDVNPSPQETMFEEPTARMQQTKPLNNSTYVDDIIVKLEAADAVFGVEGGAGSSLQADQKRTLHVRGVVTPREDGRREVSVQLFKPLGSTFRFLADTSKEDGGQDCAPSSLAYLAAGVGFCFMTQIGRYAKIMKHDLRAYSIVQDTIFGIEADSASAQNVDTHLFLETGEPVEASRQTLFMSERTCFLHAAMRSSNKTRVIVVHNH